MPLAQLAAIRTLLAENPIVRPGATLADMRKGLDAMANMAPRLPDVSATKVDAGGVADPEDPSLMKRRPLTDGGPLENTHRLSRRLLEDPLIFDELAVELSGAFHLSVRAGNARCVMIPLRKAPAEAVRSRSEIDLNEAVILMLSPLIRDLALHADRPFARQPPAAADQAISSLNAAASSAESARFIASAQSSGTPALSIPGLGSTQTDTAKVQIPEIKGDLVTPARSLRDTEINPAGNLDVNLVNALQRPGSRDDLLVEDGDVVIVPARPSTVTVSGAVMVPAAVLFTAGSTAGSYIDRAGGFAIDAATDRILVIRARGAVVKASRHTRVELGDIVFVPTKVMAARLTDREAEIDSISKRVTAAGIVFALIRSLLIR